MSTRGDRRPVVNLVNAPCGWGKTHRVIRHIARNQFGSNHLYLAPNLKLLDEVRRGLEAAGVSVEVITSEQAALANTSVKKAAIDYFIKVEIVGHVLLMTHQAYAKAPYIMRKSNWALYIDELPPVDTLHPFSLPINHRYLTDNLNIIAHDQTLSRVKAKAGLRRVLQERKDDVFNRFRDFFTDVDADIWDVFVDTKSYRKALEATADGGSPGEFFFISMINESYFKGFHSVTVLGANVEDSLVFHYLGDRVRFRKHPTIKVEPREGFVPWAQRVRIQYLLDRDFSKYVGQLALADGRTVFETMDEIAATTLGAKPFLWNVNKFRKNKTRLRGVETGIKIPVMVHGINAFAHVHAICFVASLNRGPHQYKMLKGLGLSYEVVRKASTHETIYQAVMRTSLRVPTSTEVVHIIVPDKASALRLQVLLGASTIEKIGDIDLPEKERPFTKSERQQRQRATEILKDLGGGPDLGRKSLDTKDRRHIFGSTWSPEIQADLDSIGWRGQFCDLVVTLQAHKKSTFHNDFDAKALSWLDFKMEWKALHRTPWRDKESRPLYNLTYFGPRVDGELGYRTQANFVMAPAVGLDVDGGILSKDDILRIFWDDPAAPMVAFLLYSSFRCGPEDPEREIHPNKFHIIFPLASPITSVRDYKTIYGYLTGRIVAAGLDLKAAEIDANLKSGIQSFYIPARNAAIDAKHQFFEERGCRRERELARFALRPEPILKEARSKPPMSRLVTFDVREPTSLSSTEGVQERVRQAVAEFRTLTHGRRTPFWLLGLQLHDLGLSWPNVHTILAQVAHGNDKLMRWHRENMLGYQQKAHTWFDASKSSDDTAGRGDLGPLRRGSPSNLHFGHVWRRSPHIGSTEEEVSQSDDQPSRPDTQAGPDEEPRTPHVDDADEPGAGAS